MFIILFLTILIGCKAPVRSHTVQQPSDPSAGEWPTWRGSSHDGVSKEKDVFSNIERFGPNGPPVIWKKEVTGGYSSITVSKGRAFTMTRDGEKEVVLALDAVKGNLLWEFSYESKIPSGLDRGYLSGPRATPVVDHALLFTLGTTGVLNALNVRDGSLVWTLNLREQSNRPIVPWGYSSSPLVVGDRLFVQIGGDAGRSVGAVDKRTGHILWTTGGDIMGYSSPIPFESTGQLGILFFTGNGLLNVSAESGKIHWNFPWETQHGANIASPVVSKDKIFISSGYNKGSALLEGSHSQVREVWSSQAMRNHYSTSILFEDHLFGFSDDRLRCIHFETGQVKWDRRRYGKGSLLIADGMLTILSEQGKVALIPASPEKENERAFWQALTEKTWASPALADGRLYVRGETQIVVLDLKPESRK